jgi:uncharacterized protein
MKGKIKMDDKIRILSISDIHGASDLIPKAEKILKQVDYVLISGDITNFGKAEDAAEIISKIQKYNKNVYAVTGNCDYPDIEDYLNREKLNLGGNITDISGVKLLGFSGSLTTPNSTPNENNANYYRNGMEFYENNYPKDGPVIIISHQPPYGTLCDTIGDAHIGCKNLADFIDKHQPLACFCGHVHDADGVDQIGDTYIMNPGRFSGGGAILAEINLKEKDASLTFVELFE